MGNPLFDVLALLLEQAAAWALIGVTALAAGASVWVAVLAHRNGTQATRIAAESVTIAKQAAERDEARVLAESRLREQARRSDVARSIFRLLAAVDSAQDYLGKGSPSLPPQLSAILGDRLVEASADISLYATSIEEVDLLKWMNCEFEFLKYLIDEGSKSYRDELANAREDVVMWNKNIFTGFALLQRVSERHQRHDFTPPPSST